MVVTGDGLAREPVPGTEHDLVSFPSIFIGRVAQLIYWQEPGITSTSLEIFTTPSS